MQAFDSPVPFWKMSGSGNDFVVIDNRSAVVPHASAAGFTRAVCQRGVSVGADGVVLISTANEADVNFRWRYLNADGSDGEMCGNGAMCAARFALLNGIAPERCCFRTPAGLVHAEVDPHSTKVQLAVDPPGPVQPRRMVDVDGVTLVLHPIAAGVPHAVLIVEDADAFAPGPALLSIGRAVRHHPAFAPAGTNLNVVSVRDRATVRMRTYERGVESETLACGTGAIACAVIATALGLMSPPIDVVTSGGGILSVAFGWDGVSARNVKLGGEARVIIRGEIAAEALDPREASGRTAILGENGS